MRFKKISFTIKLYRILGILTLASFQFFATQAQDATDITPQLSGIGLFESSTFTGIIGSSFAGGMEIQFTGQGMSMTPADFTVYFTSSMISYSGAGPALSQDNSFNSKTGSGKLQYTTPSTMTQLGITYDSLASIDYISFNLRLIDSDSMTGTISTLACTTYSYCNLIMSRWFTPVLYYLNPPVVYYGSELTFVVDPRSSQNYKDTVELPFTEARISSQTIDFEGFVDSDTLLSGYSKNFIRGNVGHVEPKASAAVNFKFKAGDCVHQESQISFCSYDNTNCYKAKAVAVINSISASSGYTTGGQTLTIKGYGFNSDNINVVVDGAQCIVKTYAQETFTCQTGSKPLPSFDAYYIGQHGLKRQIFNTSTSISYDLMQTLGNSTNILAMNLEAQYNYKSSYYGNIYTGYFKAPATANYRFYVSCDDACVVYLSNVDKDPSQKTIIYNSPSYTGYRKYFTPDDGRASAWIPLAADGSYYIEVQHVQYSGADHLTISVEIDQVPVAGHYHSMKEIQRFTINPVNVREQSVVTVTNPDSGTYIINFQNPKTLKWTTTVEISAKATSAQFKSAVSGFFSSNYAAPISVTRVAYDTAGLETTDLTLAKTIIYTIQVEKALSTASFTTTSPQKISTSATIAIKKPSFVQLSSIPLAGTFKLQCALSSGSYNQSEAISAQATIGTILTALQVACPQYRDNVDIWEGTTYGYIVDGRDILIRFFGINSDIPQITAFNNTDDPLIGINITMASSTMKPFGTTIMYEPVPFEFLYTNEANPQVIVSVDGIEAVCASLSCDYNYEEPVASITDFSLSGTTLTITGTSLPTTDIQSIYFSNVLCTVSSSTTTQTVCTLSSVAVSGIWQPIVKDSNGLIPVSTSSKITVAVTVSSIVLGQANGSARVLQAGTNTGLNPQGGNSLKITGTNFPPAFNDGNSLFVTFSGGNACLVTSTSSNIIFCTTTAFPSGITSDTVIVTINSQSDSSKSVALSTTPATVTSIQPWLASPVLKTNLTLWITGFSGTLSKSDLSIQLIQQENSTIVKAVNVIEVGTDNGIQYIVVRFGGAYSGTYDVVVTHSTYGHFDTTGITLQAVGIVTDYTPKVGSVYGGTIVTITGYNFSTDITDNPVWAGATDCLVSSSSNTQIVCRTVARDYVEEVEEDFIVFLKTSEEAVCSSCKWNWKLTGLPALTSYAVAYDSTLGDYVLTLTGTGFTGTVSTVEVYIDSIKQTVTSVSTTTVVVQIISILTTKSSLVDFYLPIGTPSGMSIFTTTGLSLNPVFLSVSPSEGSPAGSIITAVVKGVGASTSSVTLTTSAGIDICASVTITAYGVIQCKTKVLTVASTTLKVKIGTTSQDCTGSCTYATSISKPAVASVTKSDSSTIVFTGTNFYTSLFTASASFSGVSADTVTINSATQVTAVWSKGVPLAQSATLPVLHFDSTSTTEAHWSQIATTANITNANTATSVTGVSCSFAGGCLMSVASPGLYSSLQSSTNNITVCGQICTLSTSDSTAATTKCYLPPLATTYSVTNYEITSEQYLTGTPFSSNSLYTGNLFDGDNINGFQDYSSKCYVGTAFTVGHVGVLNEVKYFMNRFTKATFVSNLAFQGSQDNLTYTTIFTVGSEIHEGWNYYSYASGSELKYRYYRFYGNGTGSCIIGEIGLRGYEAINSAASSYICYPQLNLNGVTVSLTGQITYTSTLTPHLTAITPRYGNVKGSESIVFTGTTFSSLMSDYTITLDNVNCVVTAASTISVTCTTGKRPGLYPTPTIEIKIAGKGSVATSDLVFRYVNYWSDESTWGGDFLPMEGESVWIPEGLHLIVDIDSTPILQAVLVEGSLIFPPDSDPTHLRTFDSHYVMVKGGYMEVGTEEFPYTSQLIITMHSDRESPELPIYGNKVIAVREGILDMHGVVRTPTWTELHETANIGDTSITLFTSVDWVAGERIVIAPTGYDNHEAEERVIASIDKSTPSLPVITFTKPLLYKHYAGIQTFKSDTIEMRAEVGLLTRNVIYRGDPETSSNNQYGAHIMLHSHGDESLIGRIEYCEFTDVGQAFQLGRYPIHFHLIGTVHYSYIRGNSIHQTYNRAVTIHAVHYLRIIQNVAYNTMGHTFFIEDAVETKNFLYQNLAILTKRSWSLLNTDQTPASFWITHPDNIFRGNHAAGSDRYGYWFDTKPHSMGPSYDVNVCPENSQLGEFTDNVAHSNGRYGLRIFHKLIPRTYPCNALVYDATNKTDPYWQNPLITASFENYRGWKNTENGAIAEQVGDVRFVNFKVSDNLIAGIEFSLTSDVADGYCQINNALVIGHSDNADPETLSQNLYGIITPRTENFQVHNVRFFNFDIGDMAALGSCSHCFHPAATDSGARTITFSNLYFDSTVVKRIIYQFPYRDIFYDQDGTLTGLGASTWATPFFIHNVQPECTVSLDIYNGILCDSTVQVRRLVLYNYSPSIFEGMELKVLKYDDKLLNAMNSTQKETYFLTHDSYSVIPFKLKKDPMSAWAVPYVTNHKYKIHWRYGLDFTSMQMDLSTKWISTDKNLYLIFNHTDVRAQVDVITGGVTVDNATLLTKSYKVWQTGDNVIYNDTSVRQIHVVVNGKNASRTSVTMKGYQCAGSCLSAIDNIVVENTTRRWSNASSWTSGKVPTSGQSVIVESGWNMIYDIALSPILEMVEINGRLTFEQGSDLHLRAKYVFVRAGELIIGSAEEPFTNKATITLYGEKQNQSMVYDNAVEAGNKIIVNTGKIQMYGNKRIGVARLTYPCQGNTTKVSIESGLSWVTGDKLGFAPTGMRFNQSDYAVIVSYDNTTGATVLDRNMTYYHFGANFSTATDYSGVDMRGEVLLLNRNIKIQAEDVDAWGCQIVTSDFIEVDGSLRYGNTIMDSVEVYNCSQYDTQRAGMRFEQAKGKWSSITNSAIHHGWGRGIQMTESENIFMQGNVIFDFIRFGVNIETCNNITFDSNYVVHVNVRTLIALDMFVDISAGVIICAFTIGDLCVGNKFTNNVVAGSSSTGFASYGHRCGDTSSEVFKNNIAHSINGVGGVIFPDPGDIYQKENCMEGSYFTAYKCAVDGAVSFFDSKQVIYSNMIFIDNRYSGSVMIGQEGDYLFTSMRDTIIYGETESKDCQYEDQCKYDSNAFGCFDRAGIQLSVSIKAGKSPFPKGSSSLPLHKIKTDASWGGTTLYNNLTFTNFKSNKTWCGTDQFVLTINEHASDYVNKARFRNTKFDNVEQNAFAYIFSPPQAWANIDDCGNFPCTAPLNILMWFEKTTFTGKIQPLNTDANFQIISNNEGSSDKFNNCRYYKYWNAYQCTNENLAILLFESLDDDKWKRMVTPIKITNPTINSLTSLNTFMDHIWDGFYTGQLRLSRWPALIQTGTGSNHTIYYSSTPPNSQRFWLQSEYAGTKIIIKYPKAGAYILKDSKGAQYQANAWDDSTKQPGVIKSSAQCGENRYIGVVNILEFYISPNCTVYVESIDSIQSSIRLNWTMTEFYADGGTTKFIDRMAASLGIHASTIKVVSVYTGSVIVEFNIQDPKNLTKSKGGLTAINTLLTSQIKSGKINLGAPILSASVGSTTVKSSASTVVTPTNTGTTTTGTTTTTTTGGKTTTTTGGTKITNTTIIGGTVYEIQDTQDTSGKQTILIAIVCVIVALIIFGGIVGYIIYKKCKKPTLIGEHSQTVSSKPAEGAPHSPGPDEDNYEPQYHPKAELGNIFTGKQDPIQKANNADDVMRIKNQGTDDENIQQVYTNQSNIDVSHMKEDTPLASDSSRYANKKSYRLKSKTEPTFKQKTLENEPQFNL